VLVRVQGREPARVLGLVAVLEDGQWEEELVVPGRKSMPGLGPALERSKRAGFAISSARSRIVASEGLLGPVGSAGGQCSVAVPCR
jgi:hypothetical protein